MNSPGSAYAATSRRTFLSGTFAVLVFFLFALVYFHPRIACEFSSGPVRSILMTGEVVIIAFSVLFVLFSVASFLRVQSKEFGILTVLGMSRRQMNRLIILENGIIGVLAIATALVLGLLFAKYLFMVVEHVLEVPGLYFHLPTAALLLTILSFAALFMGIARVAPAFIDADSPSNFSRDPASLRWTPGLRCYSPCWPCCCWGPDTPS